MRNNKDQKKTPAKPSQKKGLPEVKPIIEPEDPVIPVEDPDIIPDEEPFETPPYEIPEPGEGP
jgi:hypothetical protein